MNRKIRDSIAATGIALGLSLGIAGGGALVTAPAASAVSLSNCRTTYYTHPGGSYAYTAYRTCYYTYTTAEKLRYPFPRNGTYSVVIPMYV